MISPVAQPAVHRRRWDRQEWALGLHPGAKSSLGGVFYKGILPEVQGGETAQDRPKVFELLQAPNVIVKQLEAGEVGKRLGGGGGRGEAGRGGLAVRSGVNKPVTVAVWL